MEGNGEDNLVDLEKFRKGKKEEPSVNFGIKGTVTKVEDWKRKKEQAGGDIMEDDLCNFIYVVDATGQRCDEDCNPIGKPEIVFIKTARILEYDAKKDVYTVRGIPMDAEGIYIVDIPGKRMRGNIKEKMSNARNLESFEKGVRYSFFPVFKIKDGIYLAFAKYSGNTKVENGETFYEFTEKIPNTNIVRSFWFSPTAEKQPGA